MSSCPFSSVPTTTLSFFLSNAGDIIRSISSVSAWSTASSFIASPIAFARSSSLSFTFSCIFRLSALDVEETVIVGYAEGIRFEKREIGRLYGECQNPAISDVFNTLYSEAYTVKEDKLIDATLVALRKLRGEGFLAEDMIDDDERYYDDNEQDLHGLEREEDLDIHIKWLDIKTILLSSYHPRF